MFETCWLLGYPTTTTTTTTQKPGLKDYGLSKAKETELFIQASRQALMRLCLEQHRGSDSGILHSLKTYSSIETEEELEQLFNTGMNNGPDKKDKNRPTNRIEKMKMKITPMTLQIKQ